MFGVRRDAVPLQLLLAREHLLTQDFELDLQPLGLRQHLAFLFLDMVPHALGKHGELRVAVIVPPAVAVELGDACGSVWQPSFACCRKFSAG